MKLVTLLLMSLLAGNAIAQPLNIDKSTLAVDMPSPLFSLKDISGGGDIKLADFKGRVIYVDFWASWCVPCRRSFPYLASIRAQYVEQGFEVIAINLDEDLANAQQFLQEYPVPYPVAQGFATNTPLDYNVNAMPSAFLIDGQGNLRSVHLGFTVQHQAFLSAIIEKLVAEL